MKPDYFSSPSTHETLVDILCYRARHQPEKTALIFLGDGERESGRLTYEELDHKARAIANRLVSLGAAGERAILLYPPGLEFISAFLGCLYAGVVAVPAYPPKFNRSQVRLSSIIKDAQAAFALSSAAEMRRWDRHSARIPELAELRGLATDDLPDDPSLEDIAISPQHLAFLQYSSGSTGAPKGVMVSHGNLIHNLDCMRQAFLFGEESVSVNWLPCFHDMGLILGMLEPLYAGFLGILISPPAFTQRPLRWLQAISNYRATHSGGPNFSYDLCLRQISAEECGSLDLSTWRIAYNGAEPVRKGTLGQFARTFESCGFTKNSFYPCYGLAESTLMVSGGLVHEDPLCYGVRVDALEQNRVVEPDASGHNVQHLVGCGRAWLDTQILIVDPDRLMPCGAGQVGEIWVSGPSVAQGYWNKPEETQRTFQACLAGSETPHFLRTGDLGFLKDGELFVTGRLKDLIIIRGRNLYPQDIELTAEQSHPALRPTYGAAFAIEVDGEEQLVVAYEVERTALRNLNVQEMIDAIRRNILEEHEVYAHDVALLRTGTIPKTSSGKIQRRACRSAYLDHSLEMISRDIRHPTTRAMKANGQSEEQEGAIAPRVLRVVADFVCQNHGRKLSVHTDSHLHGDLGLDSLAVTTLVTAVEQALGIEIDLAQISCLASVNDLIQLAQQAGKNGRETHTPNATRGQALQERMLERMLKEIPQLQAVVEEQNGRMVKIKGRWFCDFASANYLGLDLHPEVMASIAPMIAQWGVHPSWTRAVASPEIYRTLERRLASFVGAPDTLIFPTITLLHMGVLPLLAKPSGVILLDQEAHNSMWEAARLAGASGTAVDSFAHNDLEDLQDKLVRHKERGPKIIAVDGVYSMSGSYPPLPELIEIAHRHKARLYIDDAHGFGIVGENPTRENPYGEHGNGIVRYFGRRYAEDNIVYVAGMSKAFSSMIAFVTCANDAERQYLANASTLVFGGPTPTASLASALAGLEINEKEGAAMRNRVLDLSWQLSRGARSLGMRVHNNKLFPLISVVVGDITNTIKACQVLWDHGILVTPALFPVVPLDHGLLRFTLTAANTQEQVSQALEALNAIQSTLYRTHNSRVKAYDTAHVGCDFTFGYTQAQSVTL